MSAPGSTWPAWFKNTRVKLELLTNINILLMVQKETRGRMCHAIHRYAKPNNKYIKNYDKNTISSYVMYLDANNVYGWKMSQNLPANSFEWVEELSQFKEDFIKDYYENGDKEYFLEVDVEYPKNLHNLHSDLPFLLERLKIEKWIKLVCNVHDQKNYVVHIKALKKALNHELILKSTQSN